MCQEPLSQLTWVMNKIEYWRPTRPGSFKIDCRFKRKVIEPGLYLAAECIYSSICDKLPTYRAFRGCQFTVVADNAFTVMHLLFSGISAILRMCGTPIHLSNLNSMDDLTMIELRVRAIESLIPGSTSNVGNRDLTFGANGFVTSIAPLRRILTQPLDCAAVSMLPGSIRWRVGDLDTGNFPSDSLSSVELQNSAEKTENTINTRLQRVRQGYPGLEPQQEENDAENRVSDQCYRQDIDNHNLLTPARFSTYYDRLDLIHLRSLDCQKSRRT